MNIFDDIVTEANILADKQASIILKHTIEDIIDASRSRHMLTQQIDLLDEQWKPPVTRYANPYDKYHQKEVKASGGRLPINCGCSYCQTLKLYIKAKITLKRLSLYSSDINSQGKYVQDLKYKLKLFEIGDDKTYTGDLS